MVQEITREFKQPEPMNEESFIGANKDFFGFLASMACAIHCAALPFILTIGALGSLSWLENPLIEYTFIAISLILASWSIIGGFLNHHKNLTVVLVVLLGFALIVASRLVEGPAEAILTSVGGVIIAIAHIYNWRLMKSCSMPKRSR